MKKLPLLIIVLLASLVLLCGCPSKPENGKPAASPTETEKLSLKKQKQIEKLLTKAKNEIINKKFQTAIKTYDEVLQVDPNNEKAMEGKADALILIEKYDEAEQTLNKLLKKYPDNYEAHLHLTRIFMIRNEMEKYRQQHEKAFKLRSSTMKGNLEYGIAMTVLGNSKKSARYLNTALKYKPEGDDLESIYRTLGEAYKNSGQLDKAAENYKKALEIPTTPKRKLLSYIGLMLTLAEKGELEKAQELVPKIRSIKNFKKNFDEIADTHKASFYSVLGEFALAQADYDKVIKYYSRAIDLSKNNTYYLTRAQAYFMTGQDAKARQDIIEWKKIKPENPQKPDNLVQYSIAYMIEGDYDNAIKFINYAAQRQPQNPGHVAVRAVIKYVKGDKEGFKKDSRKFEEQAGKDGTETFRKIINLLKKHR